MVEYIIQPEDFRKILESMQELFQETQNVTPKMLAERITQKIGRKFSYHHVSYLFTLLGFVTTITSETGRISCERFIVRDDERINKLMSELPQIEARTRANAGKLNPSIYSGGTEFGNYDYFRPY
jgi:tetrahydromethanopterin S-methyltransferase subunit G